MKRPLLIAFLLILFNSSFGQTDTLKFKQFGDSIEFSDLNLNSDKTFEFHHYNMHSCWTWYSVYGKWTKKNNKIVFVDTIKWEEDLTRMDTTANNKTEYVLLTVKNDYGKPLAGIKINYALMWYNSVDTYLTDEKGQIKINKDIIAKQRNKKYGEDNIQFAIHFSNKKSSECSMSTSFDAAYDKIDITLVDNPKEELIIRTTTYRIDCNDIYFEGQSYGSDKGYGVQNWGNFRATTGRITTGNRVDDFTACKR